MPCRELIPYIFLSDDESLTMRSIFGGEGGNHAIVDGVELANMLIDQSDIGKGVSSYYDLAFRRCSDAVRRSVSPPMSYSDDGKMGFAEEERLTSLIL